MRHFVIFRHSLMSKKQVNKDYFYHDFYKLINPYAYPTTFSYVQNVEIKKREQYLNLTSRNSFIFFQKTRTNIYIFNI